MMKAVALTASRQTANASPVLASVARAGHSADNAQSRLARMQSSLGNQGMERLLRRGVLQAKLTVNQPGDVYEQEADHVADAVMRMPDPGIEAKPSSNGHSAPPAIQRMCHECEDELHRWPTSDSVPNVDTGLESRVTSLGHGQPLPQDLRRFFEPRFGRDFSHVRVYSSASAAETAGQLQALAYTRGNDVVFGAGQYQPATHQGRRLIAHELTHVVQQNGLNALRPQQTIQRQEPVTDITLGAVAAKCIFGALVGALLDAAIQAIIHSIKKGTWRFWRTTWDYCSLFLAAVIGCIAEPVSAATLEPWIEERLGAALGEMEGTLLGKILLFIGKNLAIKIPELIVHHLAMLGCISPEQAAELGVHRGAPDIGPEAEPPAPTRPTPTTCKPQPGDVTGDVRVLMKVNTAEFLKPEEEVKVDKFADSVRGTGAKVNVHGLASTDGPADFNDRLSCTRALHGVQLLRDRGISDTQIADVFKHGEVSGPREWERSVVFERTGPAPGPPGPGPGPGPAPRPAPTTSVSLASISFTSDHNKLTNNELGWDDGGVRYPKPEWRSTNPDGRCAPISHEKGKSVQVKAQIDVASGAAAGTPIVLKGEGSRNFLSFEGAGVVGGGGAQEIALGSKSAIPDQINKYSNETIIWSASLNNRVQFLGTSMGHDVLATYGNPEGIPTYKRVSKAIDLTKGFGNNPHDIIGGQMRRFPCYGPNFVQGNIWVLPDFMPLKCPGDTDPECQATVRFVMAVNKAIGLPGRARGIVIYAAPSAPTKALEADIAESGGAFGGMSQFPGVGLFDGGDNYNSYEAALEYANGSADLFPDRQRLTRYYPGGVPSALKSKDDVLNVFKQMAEMAVIGGKWRPGKTIWCYPKHAPHC